MTTLSIWLIGTWLVASEPVSVPTARLVGPEQVEGGQSAVIQIEEPIECVWQVKPAGTRWISGKNERVSFVVLLDLPPGRHFVSCVSFEQKLHETKVLQVGSSPAPPAPGPAPTPSRFGLSKEVAEWVTTSVMAEHRRASPLLAGSFRSIRSAIVAGTLTEPASILRETLASNNLALGSHVDAWRTWGSKLEARLSGLHRDGKLRQPGDFSDAWEEIAVGLESTVKTE